MGWRDNFGVHPAADVFPMMPEEELDALAADIKANGLRTPISFFGVAESERKDDSEVSLADGRNRLEAMDRAGVELKAGDLELLRGLSPAEQVAFIISKNIRRRHLTKAQQADLIVAAIKAGEKPTQDESVSSGGRGKVNAVKQAAIAAGKEHGISKGTIGRSLAKAEGREPKPKPKRDYVQPELTPRPEPQVKAASVMGMAAEAMEWAEFSAASLAEFGDEIDMDLIDACAAAADAWMVLTNLLKIRALPADGRSEGAVDDPTPENEGDGPSKSSELFAKLEAELKSKKK